MFRTLTVLVVVSLLMVSVPAISLANVACVAETKAAPEHNGILFEQFYLPCLSHASYFIGDLKTKRAVVIDPQRDVDQYIAEAKAKGLHISHVFLTHVHADFVAGHQELQQRTNAEICLGAKAPASYKFRSFKDGDELALGNVRLRILETPGHTPDAISILIYDQQQEPDKPYAVLTGDCLFIGDVGRPDLLASSGVTSEELASMLYDSLHQKLMPLPDSTLVYPAHGAGSLCGKNLSKETVSTIGEQKQTNYALKPMAKQDFVKLITANQPTAPKYFSYDAAYNCKPHKTLNTVLTKRLKPLSAEEAIRLCNGGAQLLDSREADEYAGNHAVDSLNIPMSGRFAMWAGAFLDPEKPIVIIAKPGSEKLTATRLGRIGFDNVSGYVRDGIEGFKDHSDLLKQSTRETVQHLRQRQTSGDSQVLVVDIRTDSERNEMALDGSLHIPLINLPSEINKLPRDRDLVIQCATGFRSSIAASLLRQKGITRVTDLAGGITAWKQAGLPLNGTVECTKSAAE